jgi:hypothetical protein
LLSSMPNVVSIAALDQFCHRALAREPQHRFQSAREMLDEWWNVVSYIDEEAPLTLDSNALDVVFEDEPDQDALVRTLVESHTGSHPAATQREPQINPESSMVASSGQTMPETLRPPQSTQTDEGGTTSPGSPSIKRLLEEELALYQKPPTTRGSR